MRTTTFVAVTANLKARNESPHHCTISARLCKRDYLPVKSVLAWWRRLGGTDGKQSMVGASTLAICSIACELSSQGRTTINTYEQMCGSSTCTGIAVGPTYDAWPKQSHESIPLSTNEENRINICSALFTFVMGPQYVLQLYMTLVTLYLVACRLDEN
eukprot:183007_1